MTRVTGARARVGRLSTDLALFAWAGAAFVWASGGFVVGRLSVRSPRPLLFAAIACTVAALAGGGWRACLSRVGSLWAPRARWVSWAAGLMSAAVIVVGLLAGSFVAGGSDSSGYLSQSRRWLDGRLTWQHELAERLVPRVSVWALAPLGYRPGPRRGDIVPIYPPGYPLVLAAVRPLGGERAAYAVVPLLGGLAVWLAFLVGRRLADGRVGAGAALLLATSPTFLFQLLQPMSDIPATAWWLLASLGCLVGTGGALVGGGLAASLAVLTRPNLVPLAALLGLYVFGSAPDGPPGLAGRVRRLGLFVSGALPGCVAVGVLHHLLYGSPFASGYGPVDDLYARDKVWANLHHYPAWLLATHARLIWLAPLALLPWVARGQAARTNRGARWLFATVPLLVLGVYLPYGVFEDPSYLRFLLPGLPFVFALTAFALIGLTSRLQAAPAALLAIGALTLAGGAQLGEALDRRIFDYRRSEARYAAAGHYVAAIPPERVVVLARQHSGSLAYYTRAPVLRWDLLNLVELDSVLALARAEGRRVLIVLDDEEEAAFRARLAGHGTAGRLDWPARARVVPPGTTRVYDVADRDEYLAGRTVTREWIETRR